MKKRNVKCKVYLGMVFVLLLWIGQVQAFAVSNGGIIISGSNITHTIQNSGDYQLDPNFSGTVQIHSNASSVRIIGSGKVNDTKIIVLNRTTQLNLYIEDLQLNSTGNGLDIQTTNTVNLYVDGICSIKANQTAVHVPGGKNMVIDNVQPKDMKIPSLTVTSGIYCAGIGGGNNENGGNVTIKDVAITANGGMRGAGIGGGQGLPGGNGGNVTIQNGSVYATGGLYAAGIGGGWSGNGGTVTISNGTVVATGSDRSAGIGGGFWGDGGTVTISGGNVTATGGRFGSGIGIGQISDSLAIGETVVISGGVVTATGGFGAPGIGGGPGNGNQEITISGGTINATGGNTAAGIGGGQLESGEKVIISGGVVTATGGNYGSGIGGGADAAGNAVIVTGTPTIIANGYLTRSAEHIGRGGNWGYNRNYPDSILSDSSGNPLHYTRFQITDKSQKGIAGANVRISSAKYTTNAQGITGCVVPGSSASYTVSAQGYPDTTKNLALTAKNIDVQVVMSNNQLIYHDNGATGGSTPASSNFAEGAVVIVSGNTGNLLKDGYVFNGWNTVADGTGTSYAEGDTFAINGDVNLYAQWKLVPIIQVESVTLSKATITLLVGNSDTLIATVNPTNARDKAITWLSTNPAVATVDDVGHITAIAKGTTTVTATSMNGKADTCTVTVEEPATHKVTFVDGNGKVIQSGNIQCGSDIVVPFPADPFMFGYTFTGWNKTSAQIQAATDDVVVTAQFRKTGKFIVQVANGTLSGGVKDASGVYIGEFSIKDSVTITANAPATGKKFSCWKDSEDTVVSYNSTYRFYASADITLTAQYVATTTEVEEAGSIVIRSVVVDQAAKKITFTADRVVPQGAKIIAHGIILTSDATVGTSVKKFYLGGSNILISTATKNDPLGTYVITKKDVATGVTWYGRAFMTYQTSNGGTLTVYSGIKSGTRMGK